MDRWNLCMRASTLLFLTEVCVSQPKLATEVTVEGDFLGRSVWKRTLVWEASCATSGLPLRRGPCCSLAVSGWLALPRLVAGCMITSVCNQTGLSWLTLTDPELEKQSGTHRAGTGNPSESLFGEENMRQLPTEQSAPKGVEGTSKSGQGPYRACDTTTIHKAGTGSDLVWFPPFDKKEILILLWFK